ncbi:MAG: hypothetical protein P8164_01990, partial [Gammaproteobacteria bacterium]
VKMAGIAADLVTMLGAEFSKAVKAIGAVLQNYVRVLANCVDLVSLWDHCPFGAIVGLLLLQVMIIEVIAEACADLETGGIAAPVLAGALEVSLNAGMDKYLLEPMKSVCK